MTNFLAFWGKARPSREGGPGWHPIAYHLLDVAAVAEALLLARPLAAWRSARSLGLHVDDARTLVVALAGLHDLGKFAPAFQAKAPEYWPTGTLGHYSDRYAVRRQHTEDGYVLWDEVLAERIGGALWPGAADTLAMLAPGVFGHHGRPVGTRYGADSACQRFHAGTLGPANDCADAVLALLISDSIVAEPPDESRARLASWWVSGLITVADWVGSNERWFPYTAPDLGDATLAGYWRRAQSQARRAVREAGLVPCQPSPNRPFSAIARVNGAATPVQAWASEVNLLEGPTLVVIEDVTGSGKTEAAQMLVHRLMAAGHATGAYWAMPTMATANAMYARQREALGALYAPGPGGMKPSLVLAHGQQRLHAGFRSTVLGDADAQASVVRDDADIESTIACAAFLADDRRAALLADVGAGTVDQAILAALPSRFNTVRLFGLADKVLVIDEAHAYDAYMSVEIQELLRFQAALGGSAVVLSATLSHKQRAALAQAWADGTSGGRRRAWLAAGAVTLASGEYPLATMVSEGPRVEEFSLGAAPWSHRSVAVRLVHDVSAALTHVLEARGRGGAVAWVRNTVDDCLEAAARLRERGVEPLVFHARFAQGDRQAREADVMRRFGKEASDDERRGQVLVATQVIEQSLDLDFDAMVSDVAPIDLLVQRAGRLHRHAQRNARRPEGLAMELLVLSPEPLEAPPADWLGGTFKGTSHVYEDAAVLWRTVRVLAEVRCIETPGGLRALIERVYDPDAEPPASLLPNAQRAAGRQGADAAAAIFAVLKAPDGYHADAVAWVSDMRVPTRLGDLRTTLRLARVRADGGLDPWVRSDDGVPWKSWALSEVSVSAYRVPAGSMPAAPYARAVEQLRNGWSRFEQDAPVVPLVAERGGEWRGTFTKPDGKVTAIAYTAGEGLAFPRKESEAAR